MANTRDHEAERGEALPPAGTEFSAACLFKIDIRSVPMSAAAHARSRALRASASPCSHGRLGAALRISCRTYRQALDRTLVDRHAQRCRDYRQRDRREPYRQIRAGEIEDRTAHPGANEGA